jgi:hypothetical protein
MIGKPATESENPLYSSIRKPVQPQPSRTHMA